MAEEQKPITFHYIKSPQCRNLVVHGVFGGGNTANGQFHMAVFSERPPIPQEIFVAPDGTEVGRSGKAGVVREIDAVLHFDINLALNLLGWLEGHIDNFKKAHPEVKFPEKIK